jgi:Ca2+/Na+ antiporter
MNKEFITRIKRLAISLAIAFCAIIPSYSITLIAGYSIGRLINPTMHNHNYECACDETPPLNEMQAFALGILVFLIVLFAILVLIRRLKFTKWEQVVALIIYAIINYGIYSTAIEILSVHVTG